MLFLVLLLFRLTDFRNFDTLILTERGDTMKREEFLKQRIESRYGSVHRFAGIVEMPPSTIYSILKNVGGASIQHIFKICTALDISVDELASYGESKNAIREKFTQTEMNEILSAVELYDYIPYSTTLTPSDVIHREDGYKKLAVPNIALGIYAGDKEILFMHVTGDSMDKVLGDGALIAVKRGTPIHALKDKDIVLVSNGNEIYLKVFFYDTKNNRLLLKPLSNNPMHLPLVKPIEEGSVIMGKVVAFNVVL